jgi:hypothetical protein
MKFGGRDRDRTCDLMLAKHALSQLSYTPIFATVSDSLRQFWRQCIPRSLFAVPEIAPETYLSLRLLLEGLASRR